MERSVQHQIFTKIKIFLKYQLKVHIDNKIKNVEKNSEI